MNKLCKCKEQQYREYLDYCFYRSATDRGGIIDGMINKLKFLLKTNCHCEEKSELPDNITTADLPPVEGGKCPECGTKIPTDAYAHIFEKGAWLRSKPRIGSVTDGFVKVDGWDGARHKEYDICPDCFFNKVCPFIEKESKKLTK